MSHQISSIASINQYNVVIKVEISASVSVKRSKRSYKPEVCTYTPKVEIFT